MNKHFDCVEMKRQAQERVFEETRQLSREERLAYFQKAGERFWEEVESLRRDSSGRKTRSNKVGRKRR